mmetsp:Transcript_35931/g.102731  ORF Transcript_35931/g.102731 Transcript_35931/m.102731 type:complete len:818 (-) Transcript_35931:100-2553(-)
MFGVVASEDAKSRSHMAAVPEGPDAMADKVSAWMPSPPKEDQDVLLSDSFGEKRIRSKNSTINGSRNTAFNENDPPESTLIKEEDFTGVLRRARMTKADWLLSTPQGQYALIIMIGFAIVISCGFSWSIVTWHCDDVEIGEMDLRYSIFHAWDFFIDPGTQTGIDPERCVSAKLVAMLFSMLGFIWNLVLLGIIVESARSLLERWAEDRYFIVLTGHVVILGWSDKTEFLLEEVLRQASDDNARATVVILAERSRVDMKLDIRQFMLQHRDLQMHNVKVWQGCPHSVNSLMRVSTGSARTVIVLGTGHGDPHKSDLQVVRTVAALAALPESHDLSGKAIAEVECADTVPVVEALLPQSEGICARSAVNRMLCLLAAQPVVGDCFLSIIPFRSGVNVCELPATALTGTTFGAACRQNDQLLCVGIRPKGEYPVMGPPDDTVLAEGDVLIFLVPNHVKRDSRTGLKRTRSQMLLHSAGQIAKRLSITNATVTPVLGDGTLAGPGGRYTAGPAAKVRQNSLTASIECMPVEESVAGTPRQEEAGTDAQGRASSDAYVIIGFADDFPDILNAFDAYVAPGTKVHVLSCIPVEQREQKLSSMPEAIKNITLVHHEGNTNSVRGLTALPLAEAKATLVLAEGQAGKVDAVTSDSACLAVAVTIDAILNGRYGSPPCTPRGRIVCEMLDPQAEVLIKRNEALRDKFTFFQSNAVMTSLFTMAAYDPQIFNCLVLMLHTGNSVGELTAILASEVVRGVVELGDTVGEHLSWWELHQRIRDSLGGILVGFQDRKTGEKCLVPDVIREKRQFWPCCTTLLVIRGPKA